MSDPYVLGNIIRLSCSFTNEEGEPADPTTVVAVVQPPKGADIEIPGVRTSEGEYYCYYKPARGGSYIYRFYATGDLTAAVKGKFKVEK